MLFKLLLAVAVLVLVFVLSRATRRGSPARRQPRPPKVAAKLSTFEDESGVGLQATITNIDDVALTINRVALVIGRRARPNSGAEIQLVSSGVGVAFTMSATSTLRPSESIVVPYLGTPGFHESVVDGDTTVEVVTSAGPVRIADESFRTVVLKVIEGREPEVKARIKRDLLVPKAN
jgi:hypothetical protein